VRESAFSGLSQLANPRAFDLMIEMLGTFDPIQWEKAEVGLGKIGNQRAIEPIIESLRQKAGSQRLIELHWMRSVT
jgi:HEAT repeat protein